LIYLATDHRGFELKEKIKLWLSEWGYEFKDMGATEYDPDDDYPDFVHKAAQHVSQDPENSKAIILGATGQGEAIVANRYKNVRAIVCYGHSEEIIKLSRQHNNANILSLAASFLTPEETKKIVQTWLKEPFSNEERHIRRIDKIER